MFEMGSQTWSSQSAANLASKPDGCLCLQSWIMGAHHCTWAASRDQTQALLLAQQVLHHLPDLPSLYYFHLLCVWVVTCAKMHVWKSEDTLRGLAFSFHRTQVMRAGSRTRPPPNHITTPSPTSKPTVIRILFLSSLFATLILYLVVRHKILLESVYTIMAVVHFFSLKTILLAWHSVS